jgi:lipopolysaccharide biosynthesis regulator YciM
MVADGDADGEGTWPLRRFAEELRELKLRAGDPTLAEIRSRTKDRPAIATISVLLAGKGRQAPSLDRVFDVVAALAACARKRGLDLGASEADLRDEWRRRYTLLEQAMERTEAERAARLKALLAEFSVLPADQIRRPPFHTLGELAESWDSRPGPAGGEYLPRADFDEELRAALVPSPAPYPFLLVYGDDRAGKSTSAWKAVVETVDSRVKVLVPRDGSALAALAAADGPPAVVTGSALIWADGLTAADLDRLTPEKLDRLAGTAVIVATISADECAAILDAPRDRYLVARGALRSAYLLHLPYDQEIADQVALNSAVEIAAPEDAQVGDVGLLILRLTTARSKSPAGMALVRAAIDCRRGGLRRPVSDGELRRLFPHYLAEIRNIPATDELFESGLAWAQGSGSAADAMLTVMPHRGRTERLWAVARTLVDGAEPNRAIPDVLWAELIDAATPLECDRIGYAAGNLGRMTYAAQAHTKAASVRDIEPRARLLAAAAYNQLGDRQAARTAFEAAYQAAVRDGLPDEACCAAYQLGNLAAADDDTDGAVRWWTDAAGRDQRWSLDAYLALGTHYALTGAPEKAIAALDRDFSSAKPPIQRRAAMVLLAVRPSSAGLAEIAAQLDADLTEPDEERLLRGALMDYIARRARIAEAAGDPAPADKSQAETLFEQGLTALTFGTRDEAIAAFERCVECAHSRYSPEAALELGNLWHEDGDSARAELAWALAAESGDATIAAKARFNRGLLRADAGDEAGAIALLESVLEHGDPDRRAHAALLIAQLRASQDARAGDVEGLYRLAIDAAAPGWSPLALAELAIRKYGRDGATGEALSLLRQASESGHPEAGPKAAWVLGHLLEERADYDGAIRAYHAAIAAGHHDYTAAAHSSLGQLYAATLDQQGLAVRHLEAAYNSGHPTYRVEAAFYLGAMHQWHGRFKNAATMFSQVAHSGHAKLWPQAGFLLGSVLVDLDDVPGALEQWRKVADSGIEPAANWARTRLAEFNQHPF